MVVKIINSKKQKLVLVFQKRNKDISKICVACRNPLTFNNTLSTAWKYLNSEFAFNNNNKNNKNNKKEQ